MERIRARAVHLWPVHFWPVLLWAIRLWAILLWLFLLSATPVHAAAGPDGPPPFKAEEIEALVAPIALYPDPVLSQVLMASTYPLEIVHAARWLKANPKVKGDAAVKAVADQPWDASVKSLVAFPQILEPMNDKLDWTQRLGDAFLAQQQDVFAAVQQLRVRAQESGNLQSNAQQKVTVEPVPVKGEQTSASETSSSPTTDNQASAGQTSGSQASGAQASGAQASGSQTSKGQTSVVRIESANPEVIYVPAYNPTVVYGTWSAPAYPPTYWPPSPAYYPGTALMSGLAWGVGLAAAGAIFSDCDWGGGDVDIDYNKVTNIDRNFDRTKVQGQGGRWQHDASHRQGVAYRDTATREKFAGQVPGADKRAQYRGRGTETSAATRPATARRSGPDNRIAAADRGGMGERASAADRPGAGDRAAAADRAGAGNRAAAPDRAGAGNRAAGADRPGAANRATSPDRSAAANRGNMADRGGVSNPNRTGSGSRGGYAGGGRDSAFSGVGGGGAAAQRSYDRGRSSMQGSSFNRPSGGGGGGRGGGGRGGGGGGRR